MTDDPRSADLVSVIVPAYNAGAFIAEAIGTALAQTHGDLEVIVIDDGSTDNTAEIVEAISSRDPRVRLLRQENCGAAVARNRGIEQARGQLIAPLDADDLWHPEKIARQVAVMQARGAGVGMVYAWSAFIDVHGRILSRARSVARHEGDVFPFLVYRNFIGNGSAPLFRRNCVLEVGGYDVSLRARGAECEDLMLYLRIAERYDIAVVPAILIGYRIGPFNLSNNVQRMKRGHELVLEAVRARHPDLPARLIRWSRSFNCMYLARRCLRRGRPRAAAWLLGNALAKDPAMMFEPAFRGVFGRLVVRFAESVGLVNARSETSPKFLDPAIDLSAAAAVETSVLSRRRHAFLKALVSRASHRKLAPRYVNLAVARSEHTPST